MAIGGFVTVVVRDRRRRPGLRHCHVRAFSCRPVRCAEVKPADRLGEGGDDRRGELRSLASYVPGDGVDVPRRRMGVVARSDAPLRQASRADLVLQWAAPGEPGRIAWTLYIDRRFGSGLPGKSRAAPSRCQSEVTAGPIGIGAPGSCGYPGSRSLLAGCSGTTSRGWTSLHGRRQGRPPAADPRPSYAASV